MIMKISGAALSVLFFLAIPAYAQDQQPSVNDIVAKMQSQLNLSSNQAASVTRIVEKYDADFQDLRKSIDDGTINQSAIDSQRQQLKAAEDQELSQVLRPDQIVQWRYIQAQMEQDRRRRDNSDTDSPNPPQE